MRKRRANSSKSALTSDQLICRGVGQKDLLLEVAFRREFRLLSKCRPTISTNSRYFYKQWQQNQYICGRNYLKLLTQECHRTIQALQKELVIKKELLRKNSSEESFNYYNDKLASMAHSLESVLFNRRLRKNHFTRRYNPTNPNHSTHKSVTNTFNKPPDAILSSNHNIRPRRRRKNTKRLPTPNTNTPLDPSSVVNLSNVTHLIRKQSCVDIVY